MKAKEMKMWVNRSESEVKIRGKNYGGENGKCLVNGASSIERGGKTNVKIEMKMHHPIRRENR